MPDETNSAPAAAAGAADPKDEAKQVEAPRAAELPPNPPSATWPAWVPLAIAAVVPILFFFVLPPLTKSGLWDPYELNVADLSRRIALNLYHAGSLALDGADNSLPHLNDLGRPQLPFSSIALGFKLFGLHEWAGRAPLAAWGVLGVLATYAFVARLVDRRAGLFAAIALTTTPLFFVQARSMLGDVCTMSAFAMAFGGLAVTIFDRDEKGPTSPLARVPWLIMGAIGLFAGFESRGGILGLATPLLAVGLAWGISWAATKRRLDVVGDAIGAVALVAGAVVLWRGYAVLASETVPKDLSLMVGAMVKPQSKYPTFDVVIGEIGHAAAPWSAFAPFALGRLFLAPPGRTGFVAMRESFARTAILVGVAAACAAHGLIAPKTEEIAFIAPALLAAACGVAIRDYERGAHASMAVGVGTLVLCGTLHHDFHELPEKAYQAFAVVGAAFPENFKAAALNLWWIALGGFAIVALLTWIERDAKRAPFDPTTYTKILTQLREAWDGMLALLWLAAVAGTAIGGLIVWIGMRTHATWLPQMSIQVRDGLLNAWWVIAFVPLGVLFGLVFACDLWLWTFNRSQRISKDSLTRGFTPFEDLFRKIPKPAELPGWLVLLVFMVLAVPAATFAGLHLGAGTKTLAAAAVAVPSGVALFLVMGILGDLLRHRATGLALGGLGVGFVLCFSYYPALANQLSPKEVFESYQHVKKEGEPLALLGVGNKTAAYYAGGEPMSFSDPNAAYMWLRGGTGGRRFLAMRAEDLPRINELYREHDHQNLPILDARSSQILLAASSLEAGEKNDNPLDKIILSAPPHPQRPLDVDMEDKLQVLGIDVADTNGKLVDSVAPGRKYFMRTYYRVLGGDCKADPCHPVTTEWEAFIHIDGYHRRHNGDHKPMNGKYPMSLWLKDDLLVDEYEFSLEPNFTQGTYTIYFGLFVGDTRLKVKSGPSDGDNRVNGGTLRVQ